MKIHKILLASILYILIQPLATACSWYDPDGGYFNLFTQSIIQDKSYTPFLLSYGSPFYEYDEELIPDDNIEDWYHYFDHKLTLSETKDLVYNITMEELNNLKFKRKLSHPTIQKLGYTFYKQYKDAIDYLIEAKYLQPYMRIQFAENPDSFYSSRNEDIKSATDLDYIKISSDLISLYYAAESPEIKLRYGYQLVRFNHYNRKYQKAIESFQDFVAPLELKNAIYYMALDQLAGAQRGLGNYEQANWNFFQVFKNSNSRKRSAYSSLRLKGEFEFQDLVNRSETKEDKVMAYFLLGYQDFNNPLPIMQKISSIDPTSETLMVLEARAISELERNVLTSAYYTPYGPNDNDEVNHLKRLLSLEGKTLGSHMNGDYTEIPIETYLEELIAFTQKARDTNQDAFWDISYAYLLFLKQDYGASQNILSHIKTNNKELLQQIEEMKMLNDIVSQPKIDKKFEEHIMSNYPSFFLDEKVEEGQYDRYYDGGPSTREFLEEILANRYLLQDELAKSYLMSNKLTYLQYNPNYELAKSLEHFYNKPHKSSFEKKILNKKLNVEDPNSFFNLVYGDYYIRNGQFKKAKESYEQVTNGKGFIPKEIQFWDNDKKETVKKPFPSNAYNYYDNISSLIFGHNVWVSYESPDYISMEEEPFLNEFDFINNLMNKSELSAALIRLKKIGKGSNSKASKANQLIGNLLYNTSKLGHYRHIFVFDINNMNGGKFDFVKDNHRYLPIQNFVTSLNQSEKDETFRQANQYYSLALQKKSDREREAQILFQLASVEQGQYYQWLANQEAVSYELENWSELKERQQRLFSKMKRERFSTYFKRLKSGYRDTETSKLLKQRCAYYKSFLIN